MDLIELYGESDTVLLQRYKDTGLKPEEITSLSDDIFRKDEDITRLINDNYELRDNITKMTLDANELNDKLAEIGQLTADRDRWKARSEALGSLITHDCTTCAHNENGSRDAHCTVCRVTLGGSRSHWLFDEARFAVKSCKTAEPVESEG